MSTNGIIKNANDQLRAARVAREAKARESKTAADEERRRREEERLAAIPKIADPSPTELRLAREIAEIRALPGAHNDENVGKTLNVLETHLRALENGRQRAHAAAVETFVAEQRRPKQVTLSSRIEHPDDVMIVRGRQQPVWGATVAAPEGPGTAYVAGCTISFVKREVFESGLREAIETERETRIAALLAVAEGECAHLPEAERGKYIGARRVVWETRLDAEIGFYVDGDARWRLDALVRRYAGHTAGWPAGGDGIREGSTRELVGGTVCTRALVKWSAVLAERGHREWIVDGVLRELEREQRVDITRERPRAALAWWAAAQTAEVA